MSVDFDKIRKGQNDWAMEITMLTSNNLDHDTFIDMGTQCCFLPCEDLSNLPQDFLRFVGFVGRAAVLYSVTLEHVSPSIISDNASQFVPHSCTTQH